MNHYYHKHNIQSTSMTQFGAVKGVGTDTEICVELHIKFKPRNLSATPYENFL